MASSGSNRFLFFIFLCLAVTAYLLWDKCHKTYPPAPPPTNSPTSILTLDEACFLLYADTNDLAEFMHVRHCTQTNIDLEYNFQNSGRTSCCEAFTRFFRHQNFYIISLPNTDDYEAFRATYINKPNKGVIGDCRGGVYAISDQCFVGDMDFQKVSNRYVVLIMRNMEFCKTENRLPKPKVKKRDPRLDDDNDIL